MKNCLSIEQSAELIRKGIPNNRASDWEELNDPVSQWTGRGVPIFTLADLLTLLPNNYPGDEADSGDKRVYLTITAVDWNRWMAKYATINEVIAARTNDEMIDAVYELLLWAIDRNHVKLD